MVRKLKSALCLFAVCVTLSGCKMDILPQHNEIEDYEVMKVFGIDRSRDDPSKVEVTFLSERAAPGGGGEGGMPKKQYPIVASTGETVFEAERKIKAHSDKKQFFGFVDYVFIGEEAAKENFNKYFDFIIRGHSIRYSPRVYIVKGISVYDFICQTTSDNLYLGDRLDNIKSDIADMSNFLEINIIQAAEMLNNKKAAAVIPVLGIHSLDKHALIGGKLPEQDAASLGYAVIKDARLAGYICEPESRGYNFLTGNVHSSAVSVRDDTGMPVGLEVLNETTTINAQFKGDTLESVTFDTHVFSNIVEVESEEDVFTMSSVDSLSSQQSEIIKGEMDQVVARSKEFKTDCIGLGERLRIKHPYKWHKLKDMWTEIYPDLTINVQVTSHMRRTYDIHEPNRFQIGGK